MSYYTPYMKNGLNNINNVDMRLQICDTLIWKKRTAFKLLSPFIWLEYVTYLQTGFVFQSNDTAASVQQSSCCITPRGQNPIF
jgi:hypothetical protein